MSEYPVEGLNRVITPDKFIHGLNLVNMTVEFYQSI